MRPLLTIAFSHDLGGLRKFRLEALNGRVATEEVLQSSCATPPKRRLTGQPPPATDGNLSFSRDNLLSHVPRRVRRGDQAKHEIVAANLLYRRDLLGRAKRGNDDGLRVAGPVLPRSSSGTDKR
jgi:hypothetical protein